MKLFRKNKEKVCDVVSFIYEYARKSKRSKAYKRVYMNIARHLNNFSQDRKMEIKSNSLDHHLLEEFIDYLKSLGLMQSTVHYIVQKIKYLHGQIRKNGYEINNNIYDVTIRNEIGETVSLSSEEIIKIYNLPVNDKEIAIIRDIFVIGCLTGMRYSDYSQLNADNIVNNTIIRKTRKTDETVIIPIHEIISEILLKYNNDFPVYSHSQQNFNKVLKSISKRSGIIDEVLVERIIGYKVVRKRIKRYKLISSHTARRSFATNAYLAGIPAARIMLITGHKSEQNFFRYIRINKTENAKSLSEHEFFKK